MCHERVAGGRMGWRLPTVEELASLVNPGQSPPLPPGAPFVGIYSAALYWSSTTNSGNTALARTVRFDFGGLIGTNPKTNSNRGWCVRGGVGHDGQIQP